MSTKYLVVKTNYEYDDQIYYATAGCDNIAVFDTEKAAEDHCVGRNIDWLVNDADGLTFPRDFVYNLEDAFSEGFIWFFHLNEEDDRGRTHGLNPNLQDKLRDIFAMLKPEQVEEILNKHITFALPYQVATVEYVQTTT